MIPGYMQIILVVVLALLLFGRGKISGLMGDVAKGINAFRRGLKDGKDEDDAQQQEAQRQIEQDKDAVDVAADSAKTESSKS